MSSGAARDANTGLVLSRLSVETTVGDGDSTFENVDLTAGASHVTGNIRWLTSVEQTELDVSLDARPLALSELGHYVPRLREIPLSPSLKLRAEGTTQRMTVNLAMDSTAGRVSGSMTGGFQNDVGRFSGEVDVEALDLEPWLTRPDLRSRVTGHSSVELTLPASGVEDTSVGFQAMLPEIAMGGYAANGVRARGSYGSGRRRRRWLGNGVRQRVHDVGAVVTRIA